MVEKTIYPGWESYPAYRCRTYEEYREISDWMYDNGVKTYLLTSGSGGYIFQIRGNHLMFQLRWL